MATAVMEAAAPTRGEHPSREEWYARRDRLPAAALAQLDVIERAKTDARNAADIERARLARELADVDQWRAAFEATLAGALLAAGAEWLVSYRVPDHQCFGLREFAGDATHFVALFDAAEHGLWPIAVRLIADRAARRWKLDGIPYRVCRPTGEISFSDFGRALEWAATYCGTPF